MLRERAVLLVPNPRIEVLGEQLRSDEFAQLPATGGEVQQGIVTDQAGVEGARPVIVACLAELHKALQQAGKPTDGELPIIKELYVAPDRRTAVEECRPFLEAKYKAYGAWGQDKALPPGDRFDLAFEELAQDRFIIGDPDDCIRELTRHVDALGVNCVILRIQWPGMEQAKVLRTIELLAERVMPALGH